MPGASVSYDKKVKQHLDLGIGAVYYHQQDGSKLHISAAYVDIRPYWQIQRSLLFGVADAGMVLYHILPNTNKHLTATGAYLSLGYGYCYRINKRGMGPYISVNAAAYSEHYINRDPHLTSRAQDYGIVDVNPVLSVGFKL